MIDFSSYQFHPVIKLPPEYEVYDFTQGYDPERQLISKFGVGRYDEDRRGMYNTDLFLSGSEARTVHMGIDVGAPVGTVVHAFFAGEVFLFAYNRTEGDYGYTLITRHEIGNTRLYALHGHLSKSSVKGKERGLRFSAGDTIAWVGDRHENGGWNPHLHFQLSLIEPETCDLPGVVSLSQRDQARKIYPDPRLVLGPLY